MKSKRVSPKKNSSPKPKKRSSSKKRRSPKTKKRSSYKIGGGSNIDEYTTKEFKLYINKINEEMYKKNSQKVSEEIFKNKDKKNIKKIIQDTFKDTYDLKLILNEISYEIGVIDSYEFDNERELIIKSQAEFKEKLKYPNKHQLIES